MPSSCGIRGAAAGELEPEGLAQFRKMADHPVRHGRGVVLQFQAVAVDPGRVDARSLRAPDVRVEVVAHVPGLAGVGAHARQRMLEDARIRLPVPELAFDDTTSTRSAMGSALASSAASRRPVRQQR